jgi:hypothetical protein
LEPAQPPVESDQCHSTSVLILRAVERGKVAGVVRFAFDRLPSGARSATPQQHPLCFHCALLRLASRGRSATSVTRFRTVGITSGRGSGRDQSGPGHQCGVPFLSSVTRTIGEIAGGSSIPPHGLHAHGPARHIGTRSDDRPTADRRAPRTPIPIAIGRGSPPPIFHRARIQ